MRALNLMYDALIGAKVPPDKALAVVQAFEADLLETLVAKGELSHLEKLTQSRFEILETKLEAFASGVKSHVELQSSGLKNELTALDSRLQNAVTALMTRDESFSDRSIIKVGGMLAGVVALALGIAKFLFA
jgi:hypothetical protein